MNIVEEVDVQIDDVEDQILNKPSPDILERLFALKRVLLTMRGTITHQREVLNKLARDDSSIVDAHDGSFSGMSMITWYGCRSSMRACAIWSAERWIYTSP